MYYSDEILEEVRSRSDVVDVISSYVKLKRSGGTYFGLCPFHNEKTGSFSVTPRKQMFYCFGCHKGGSVFTFIQLYENVSFNEAVKMLADRAGIKLPEENMSAEHRKRQSLKEELLQVLKLAATFYYYQLRSPKGSAGLSYFQGRQLSEDTMRSFGLGFATQKDTALYTYLKSKGISDERMYQAGLISLDERRGARDKFWNRVMFPIMDVNNRVVGFGGRVLGDGKPKYLNSPENEVFNKRRNLYALNIARKTRRSYLILCEGYMDVIAMHQAGFTNTVASLGTALTEEHAALIRRYTKEVILSYDSDQAGTNAALRAIPLLKTAGVKVRILHLEPYKDPDELIKAEGAEGMEERLRQAENSFYFEIDCMRRNFQLSDPEERTAFQKAVAERLSRIDTDLERENYLQAVSEKFMIPSDPLRSLVRLSLAKGVLPEEYTPRTAPVKKEKNEGLLISERRLLTWLIEYPDLYDTVKHYVRPEEYSTEFYQRAARELYDQLEKGQLNPSLIIDHFESEEEQKQAAELFNARSYTQNNEELSTAIVESIRKVAEEASRRAAKDGAGMDFKAVVEMKKRLQELGSLKIDLSREEE